MKPPLNFLENLPEILAILKKDVLEVPPPPGKNLFTPCWIPLRNLSPTNEIKNSYVTYRFNGQYCPGHHIAAGILIGQFPSPVISAKHRCDVKCCVSPTHVTVVTSAENMQEVVARDLQNFSVATGARAGERNGRARSDDDLASKIKWLCQNPGQWYHGSGIDVRHTLDAAVGIFYNRTGFAIKAIRLGQNWKHCEPVKPPKLPTLYDIPAEAIPPNPVLRTLSDEAIVGLLVGFHNYPQKRHYVRDMALKHKKSQTYIRGVLSGKLCCKVRPEVPRIDLEAEARSSLTVALVQIIRATSDSYAQVYTKGSLRKALSRACKVNFRIVTRICDRTLRGDIPDDPTRALLAVQLPSPLCFRSGAGHPNSRFSEAERLNVLRRLDQGVSPAQVAREVGASYELINDARNGVVWLSTQAAFRAEKAGAAGDGN